VIREFPLHSVEKTCRLFGVSRSAFYKAENRINERCLQEALVLNEVRQIKKDQPKLGTEKVHLKIQPFLDEHEIKLGRDKLYDLLRAYHLLPKRGRSGVKTTYSKHHFYKYPNLVKDMEVLRPNLVWCSDITYIRTGNGWSYLSLVTDAYSHKIVGWSLQPSLRAEGPVQALKMAFSSIPRRIRADSPTRLIHHSDRGIQYCCREYVSLLEKHQVEISMAKESYENPIAERINGILKEELLRPGYPSFELAQKAIKKAVRIYNTERPHRSINMMYPVEAENLTGDIPKVWKKNGYREKNKSQKNAAGEKKKITVNQS
jgi:transposase InsO family protein